MFSNQWFYCYRSAVDHQSPSFFFKAAIRVLYLLISLQLSAGAAYASQVDSLYDVDILVADESTSVREQAFQQGLDEVFIRIAGDSIVMDKLKRPIPTRYVRQFSYEPVLNPQPDDQGVIQTHHLKIQYNGSLMQKYLLDNGFPVWGEHRPDLVIWMVVRDGSNEYVLKDSDQSKLKATVDAALTRRGIPERWPLYDATDKKILNVADIRGGFKDPVLKASQRYTRGPALTGSMIWNGKEWQSSWSLLLDSGNHHWSLVGTDYTVLLNKVIDQAGDAIGVVYAITDATNKQNMVVIQLEIQGVNSVEEFHRAESYLSDLSSVTLVRPVRVDTQNVIFELTLRSSEADFLNLIHNDAELIKVKVKTPVITPETKPEIKPVPPPEQLTELKASADDTGNLPGKAAAVPITTPVEVVPEVKPIPIYHYRLSN
jgi:hypothetical protein